MLAVGGVAAAGVTVVVPAPTLGARAVPNTATPLNYVFVLIEAIPAVSVTS